MRTDDPGTPVGRQSKNLCIHLSAKALKKPCVSENNEKMKHGNVKRFSVSSCVDFLPFIAGEKMNRAVKGRHRLQEQRRAPVFHFLRDSLSKEPRGGFSNRQTINLSNDV